MKGKQSNGIFLLILALSCASISFWQTAEGYFLIAGKVIAWALSFIVTILMLFLNVQIRNSISEGRSYMAILVVYCIPALFSFAGNFNAFYTRFMQEEWYKTELREKKELMDSVKITSIDAIKKNYQEDSILTYVDEQQISLREQILNTGDLGIGEKSIEIIGRIKKVLRTEITIVSGKPHDIEHQMQSQIDSLQAKALNKITRNVRMIEDTTKKVEFVIAEAFKDIKQKGYEGIILANGTTNYIGEHTKSLLNTGKVKYSYRKRKVEQLEVGKISHSFSQALSGKNPIATLFALMLSILCDFLVPIIIVVVSNSNGSKGILGYSATDDEIDNF